MKVRELMTQLATGGSMNEAAVGSVLTDPTLIAALVSDRNEMVKNYGTQPQDYQGRIGYCIFKERDSQWVLFARH